MDFLFTAIRTRYDSASGATLRGIVTDLCLSQAPQGTTYPYIVEHLIVGTPDWTFTDDFEQPVIQFSIFDSDNASEELKSAATIVSAYEALTNLYDWCTLDFSGTSNDYTSVYMKRILQDLSSVENTWQYIVQYEIFLQKV